MKIYAYNTFLPQKTSLGPLSISLTTIYSVDREKKALTLARDDFYFLEKNRILRVGIGELFYDSFQLVIEEIDV